MEDITSFNTKCSLTGNGNIPYLYFQDLIGTSCGGGSCRGISLNIFTFLKKDPPHEPPLQAVPVQLGELKCVLLVLVLGNLLSISFDEQGFEISF